jgi:hypothetical protein
MPFDPVEFTLSIEKKRELQKYLLEKFDASVKARLNQIEDKYKRWMDNYSGKPFEEVRTTPFYRASNFVPQLIRMHTDILSARIYGLLMSAKPFWKPKSLIDPLPHEALEDLSTWMDYKTLMEMRFSPMLDSAIYRSVKTGTVMLKFPWVNEAWTTGQKPKEEGGEAEMKDWNEEGIKPVIVPFEDCWLWPITCNNEREAEIVFHRIRLTKEQVQFRANNNVWDKGASTKMLTTPDSSGQTSAARNSQAQQAGITLTPDVDRPFSAIEAWLSYDLGQGKMVRIVIVFNPFVNTEEGVLRSFYNYYSKQKHCFVGIRPMPREDLCYGYSVPEILEQSQEEQAQVHNARRDANTITNVPGWKKRRYAEVPNPAAEWYPGKVFELEDMDDLQPLTFGGIQYNSMLEEENQILQLAERYTGISPPMQGFGAGTMQGKRGIYTSGGTLAMLAEGNRRIDMYLKRYRDPFHDIGNLIYQSEKNFRGTIDPQAYGAYGQLGQTIRKTFDFKEPSGFKGYYFELGASEASANKEVDRTNLLMMSNTMAGYYRQIVEAAQGVSQIPEGSPLREVLFQVLDGARDLADRLLFYFDVGDRKKLVPDIRAVFGGGSADKGPNAANAAGMSESAGPVSTDDLSDISARLATITGASRSQGNQPPAGRGPIS